MKVFFKTCNLILFRFSVIKRIHSLSIENFTKNVGVVFYRQNKHKESQIVANKEDSRFIHNE